MARVLLLNVPECERALPSRGSAHSSISTCPIAPITSPGDKKLTIHSHNIFSSPKCPKRHATPNPLPQRRDIRLQPLELRQPPAGKPTRLHFIEDEHRAN